ncbi:MAG: nickel-responsive transcriptional regulator NikR [Candidatus Baldrarchaeia archaeon]
MSGEEEKGVIRISISLPPKLLEQLDQFIKNVGYASRSKVIQDAIRRFITEHEVMWNEEEEAVGLIAIVYRHDIRKLEEEITDIQHEYTQTITSTIHIHLTRERCFEIIALKGKVKHMRELLNSLEGKRGVEHAKLLIVSKI